MAHPLSSANDLESGIRVGDFEIERRLGAGGMGIVYQARQLSLNRRVALKVLGPALSHGAGLARFQREAQAAARLKHPNIATLHFVGQDAQLCYHVIELIEGTSLRRVIERLANTQEVQSSPDTVVAQELSSEPDAPAIRFDQPTTEMITAPVVEGEPELSVAAKQVRSNPQYVRRCCEIVRDAARALAYAHGEGVTHRDIKPENLMLDQQGKVHVIDFGLARFFDDVSITHSGQLVGTPLYMSPEQVTGRINVDHRTDVYSLGMVLYELLTLRRPISFTSRENLLRNIVTKSLPPLCCRNRSLPRTLEAVVHKAMHRDPEERYQSAAAFAADLDAFLEGKPVTAEAYRYRLDVQEIVAKRPGSVVLAAFLCFLAGCTVFGFVTAIAVMTLVLSESYLLSGVQILLGFLGLASAACLSWGLLAGWNWARWVVVVLAMLLGLACLIAAGITVFSLDAMMPAQTVDPETASEGRIPDRRFMVGILGMYAVPAFLTLLCAVITVVALVRAPTRAWFRQAVQAREDHRRLLTELGN